MDFSDDINFLTYSSPVHIQIEVKGALDKTFRTIWEDLRSNGEPIEIKQKYSDKGESMKQRHTVIH